MTRILALILATVTTTLTLSALAEDWPQWRGNNRDAVVNESDSKGIVGSRANPKQQEILNAEVGGQQVHGRLGLKDREFLTR